MAFFCSYRKPRAVSTEQRERARQMMIDINERLSLADEDFASGGEQAVAQLVKKSPIKLPEDYIEFLRKISGAESGGIEFIVDDRGASIWIRDAQTAIQNYEDNKVV